MASLLQKLSMIDPKEQKATLAAFSLAFVLMAAYFVLRPVRDAMASDWSDTEVSILWNIQFFVSAALVSLYGLAVSRMNLRLVIPTLYGSFAVSFLAFYLFAPLFTDPTWLEKTFYLWVAAFSLFNLSAFWSLMADVFDDEQGKRLFAIIASGASAGAIAGPVIPTVLSKSLSIDALMLIASALLFASVPIVVYLQRSKGSFGGDTSRRGERRTQRVGGHMLAGFRQVARDPLLRGISAFIVLYVFIGSIAYFEQKNILAAYARAERIQILGAIDWVVNSLTFACSFLLSGRLLKRLGTGVSLALVPIALVIGLALLALAPVAAVLIGLQIVRRVGNYALTRPARETLFTKVSAEDRFKAKPVIDVVVYRGGDAVTAAIFAMLTEGIGLALATVSLLGAAISGLWAFVGLRIGDKHDSSATAITRPIHPQDLRT